MVSCSVAQSTSLPSPSSRRTLKVAVCPATKLFPLRLGTGRVRVTVPPVQFGSVRPGLRVDQ